MTGGGRSAKTIIAQGKIKWKKIHVRQLTLKNIHAMTLKKIHSWKSITKKNSCGSQIPHPSQVWLSNDKTVRVPPLVNKNYPVYYEQQLHGTRTCRSHISNIMSKGFAERILFSKQVPTSFQNILLRSLGVPVLFQHFDVRSTNTSRDARLDVKAGWFWARGVKTFFDVRVTHVNSCRNKNKSTVPHHL